MVGARRRLALKSQLPTLLCAPDIRGTVDEKRSCAYQGHARKGTTDASGGVMFHVKPDALTYRVPTLCVDSRSCPAPLTQIGQAGGEYCPAENRMASLPPVPRSSRHPRRAPSSATALPERVCPATAPAQICPHMPSPLPRCSGCLDRIWWANECDEGPRRRGR